MSNIDTKQVIEIIKLYDDMDKFELKKRLRAKIFPILKKDEVLEITDWKKHTLDSIINIKGNKATLMQLLILLDIIGIDYFDFMGEDWINAKINI